MTSRIEIGNEWRVALARWVADRRSAIIISRRVAEVIGLDTFDDSEVIFVSDGEEQKSWSEVISIIDRFGEASFPREGLVIGIGGGATTDLAGFVASIWMRGVDWISIPTTLSGMVDASIGGKTGINTDHGKNLVGSFHLPLSTIIDQSLLTSLPERDIKAGLAEVIKCGFISDARILDIVEQLTDRDLEAAGSSERIGELIRRSALVKEEIVEDDFREGGRRAYLNYGHTLGHALEKLSGFSLRHGEAVAIGLVFAAHLSHRLHGLSREVVDRHISLLSRVGLPITFEGGNFDAIAALMSRDKKVKAGKMRFVTLEGVGRPKLSEEVDLAMVSEIYMTHIDHEGAKQRLADGGPR